jgi:hypothetical protein
MPFAKGISPTLNLILDIVSVVTAEQVIRVDARRVVTPVPDDDAIYFRKIDSSTFTIGNAMRVNAPRLNPDSAIAIFTARTSPDDAIRN